MVGGESWGHVVGFTEVMSISESSSWRTVYAGQIYRYGHGVINIDNILYLIGICVYLSS